MNINGIYFSEYYWPRYNTLWAYRFYPDGLVLFTYADPVGRFVLHTEAGPTFCHPKDVLGNKSKLPDFFRCFSREALTQITYRSGLPAVTKGSYVTDGGNISIFHPYFQFPTCRLAGQILPDHLILSLSGTPGTITGEKKSAVSPEQVFLRLERNIFEFCKGVIGSGKTYQAKRFTGEHGSLHDFLTHAEECGQQQRTKPGSFSESVSAKNTGETAFQRALYKHPNGHICLENQPELITWKDIELPVTLSPHGRRRCVDLIGSTQSHGTFLCELKYAKGRCAPAGNSADYAILEALIYYGIISRDHATLDIAKVRHDNGKPFQWEDVKASRTIMILANSRFWERARLEEAASRIRTLVKTIQDELQVNVLLLATPDYEFCSNSRDSEERYIPQLCRSEKNSAPWNTAL